MSRKNTPDPMANTITLLQRVQDGDEGAFRELYERYYRQVARIVRFRLHAPLRKMLETEDIIQTAFGEAFCSIEKFTHRNEGAFLHWISAIIANKIRNKADYYAAMKRGGEVDTLRGTAAAAFFMNRPAGDSTPSEDASKREEEERLYAAMERLDEPKRDVLLLSRFLQRPFKEIGEILGCSEDSARMRAQRAEMALAEVYVKMGWGES